MDPVGSHGEVIMDYSCMMPAVPDLKKLFSSSNIPLKMHLKKQSVITFPNIWKLLMHIRIMDDLPEGYSVPEGREKTMGNLPCNSCSKRSH